LAVGLRGVSHSAALSRSGCRLKPAFQSVAVVKEGEVVQFRPPLGGRCRLEAGGPCGSADRYRRKYSTCHLWTARLWSRNERLNSWVPSFLETK